MATDQDHGDSGSPPAAATLPPELAEHPDYQILRELGRGGMGVVYLARNKLMGRPEVLKVISGHLLENPAVRDRFLREIQSAARLQHTNIVTAYSAMRLGTNIVLAMEYVEGDDLAKIVRLRGPLPVANACYVIYQAALGLQHAHERGMVHRDIKPANLILGREGTKAVVKVLDFGLAKVTSEGPSDTSLTRHGQTMGTPDFIAPEQIRNSRSADIRADIYSLGCTFYAILTGCATVPRRTSLGCLPVPLFHERRTAEPRSPRRPGRVGSAGGENDGKGACAPIPDAGRGGAGNIPFLQKSLAAGETSNAGIRSAGNQKARPAPSARAINQETNGSNSPGAFLGDPDSGQGARNTQGTCRGDPTTSRALVVVGGCREPTSTRVDDRLGPRRNEQGSDRSDRAGKRS